MKATMLNPYKHSVNTMNNMAPFGSFWRAVELSIVLDCSGMGSDELGESVSLTVSNVVFSTSFASIRLSCCISTVFNGILSTVFLTCVVDTFDM